MTPTDDQKWQQLLKMSASTFAAEPAPPYGFITSTLARLQTEKRQTEVLERIGWRALLASLGVLTVAAVLTFSLDGQDPRTDFDPGVRSLVQMENVPIS